MPAQTAVSIEEYLSTAYSPDRDYVDGTVEERNLGERDHSKLQGALLFHFYLHRKEWGIHVYPEQRIQVSPTRFRIPDLCIFAGAEPQEQVFHTPPFVCIEILSPEDRVSRVRERIDDYLKFGVAYVWLLDPQTRKAHRCTAEGMLEVGELRTQNPEMIVPVADLFE